jgi:hypothetical protein
MIETVDEQLALFSVYKIPCNSFFLCIVIYTCRYLGLWLPAKLKIWNPHLSDREQDFHFCPLMLR